MLLRIWAFVALYAAALFLVADLGQTLLEAMWSFVTLGVGSVGSWVLGMLGTLLTALPSELLTLVQPALLLLTAAGIGAWFAVAVWPLTLQHAGAERSRELAGQARVVALADRRTTPDDRKQDRLVA